MSEAELHSYSQRQLVSMYLHQHILPTIQSVSPWLTISEPPPELKELVKLPPERLLSVMKEQVRQRSPHRAIPRNQSNR
jgi:hypothetical protein